MTTFTSRWATWQPGDEKEKVSDTPQERTDKTDKSPRTYPSVSFVSPLEGESENFSPVQAQAITQDDTPKVLDVPKERTDKTDRSSLTPPFVGFVSLSAGDIQNFLPAQDHWSTHPAQTQAVAAQLVKKYAPVSLDMGNYKIVNAKEDHITTAVSAYPWGVVTTTHRRYLTSWGSPPASAFYGLRCALPAGTREGRQRLPKGELTGMEAAA